MLYQTITFQTSLDRVSLNGLSLTPNWESPLYGSGDQTLQYVVHAIQMYNLKNFSQSIKNFSCGNFLGVVWSIVTTRLAKSSLIFSRPLNRAMHIAQICLCCARATKRSPVIILESNQVDEYFTYSIT